MDAVVDLPMPPDAAVQPSVRPRLISNGDGAASHISQSRRGRKRLLLGVAVAALGIAAGAGVYMADHRHDSHHAPPVLGPHTVAHVPALLGRPAPDSHDHVQLRATRDDAQAETDEVLALRRLSPPVSASPGPTKQSDEHVAHAHAPTVASVAVAPVPAAAAAPASLPPVTIREVGTAAKPAVGDASDRAARLQAAPLASADQVQVLQLVTEEATLIRQQRQELAELRADQQALRQTVGSTLADYGRRLSLSEATSALHEARSSAQAAVATAAAAPMAPEVPHPATLAQPATAEVPLGSRHYRVQAASPRLAMLADQATGAQVAIAPGDILPGYGKVTAIMQYGTRWQISTEHGAVR